MTSNPPPLSANSTFISETLSGVATGNTSEKPTTEWMEQYIPADLELTREVSLDHFLEAFGVDHNDLVKRNAGIERIARDPDIQDLRDKYFTLSTKTRDERHLYGPFAGLTNGILNKLFKGEREPSIVFARNDPHYLRGTRGTLRKPDVVAIRRKMPATEWKKYSKVTGTPTGADSRWTWADVLYTVEFKIKAAQREVKNSIDEDVGESRTSGMDEMPSLPSETSSNKRHAEGPARSERVQKKPRSDPSNELVMQGVRYAVDQLSYSSNMRHVFNMLVFNNSLWICYYDRCGILRTKETLNFVDDLYKFTLLLKAMETRGVNDGFITRMEALHTEIAGGSTNASSAAKATNKGKTPENEANPPRTRLNPWRLRLRGHTVTLVERLADVRPFGLAGRGSEVDRAKVKCDHQVTEPCSIAARQAQLRNAGYFAVKRSWPAKIRESEVNIILEGQKALDALDKNSRFRKDHGIRGNLADCLPEIFYSEDLDDLENEGFRHDANKLETTGEDEDELDYRVWRVIVFELLCPIIDLDNLEEFKECFRGIFQGHHFLWTSGIHHRDISPANLMYRRLPDNSIRGVLNDWDLSKLTNSTRRSPHSRTGTRPFMAQDILVVNPPIHIERYDWESQLYVLIWIGCRYGRGGVVIDKDVLSEWLKHDFKTLYADKAVIFQKGCPPLTEYYEGLQEWILPITRLFRNGHGAIQDDKEARVTAPYKRKLVKVDISVPFDNLTLGGQVTYAKLREIYWN